VILKEVARSGQIPATVGRSCGDGRSDNAILR
jgi:hypothetical protein